MRKQFLLLLFFAGCAGSEIFRVTPVRPVDELITEALRNSPPAQDSMLKKSELVEIVELDSTIRTDIRYATENNFLSTPLYSQAKAFLQKPAAEAVARANQKLLPIGYGLLIHDAYRPWYVTKVFWDATPIEFHNFVADPLKGSKHNRGCAVDLTLYDLKTGKTIKMPSNYDEMSDRAYRNYSGGSDEERRLRDLLIASMESEGFTVLPHEWWHFDYKDWQAYPIENLRFEEISKHKD